MPTYTKETALYDTGAIDTAITNAGQTASKFLSVDSSGIMVYDGSNGTQAPSSVSSTTNNVFIDDNSVDIRKGTTALASFGESTSIGSQSSSRIELNPFGMNACSSEGAEYFHIDSNGGTETQRAAWDRKVFSIDTAVNVTTTSYVDVISIPLSSFSGYTALANGATFGITLMFYEEISGSWLRENGEFIKGTNSTKTNTNTWYYAQFTYVASAGTITLAIRKYVSSATNLKFNVGAEFIANGYSSKSVVLPTYSFGINMPDNSNSLSVSMGDGTKAGARGLAIGKYNEDGNYPFIIGGGTSTTPKTVFAVDWNGNIQATGYVNRTMTAQVSAYVTLSTSYKKMTLENSVNNLGNNTDMYISNGGIYCRVAGYILVSGQVSFYGISDNHVCAVTIEKGTTLVAEAKARSSGDRTELQIVPRLISVSAGDVIYLYVANTSSSTGQAGSNSSSVTDEDKRKNYLTVQYV